jgi:predicted permease
MHALGHDLVLAWRRLRATPGFTAFSVVTLGLGIGTTTATYSVVRVVTGPPAGVRDVGTIMNIYQVPGGGSIPMIALSWPDYQDLKARQTVFESLTAWAFFRQAFAANGRTETAWGEVVEGEYFHTLKVRPYLGRTLQPADDRIDAPPVAMISYRAWQRVFDSAPDVVGRQIKMNGQSFQIVGVAPKEFRGLFNNGLVMTAMWVPLAATHYMAQEGVGFSVDPTNRERRWLLVKGRLKPGRTEADARAEVNGIASQLDAVYPMGRMLEPRFRSPWNSGRPWAVVPMADVMVNEGADRIARPLGLALMTAVGLVLLIACTNLANLMLARGSARRHEIAVRLALGASRWRLVRESLGESVLLAMAGGAAGLAIARVLFVVIANDVPVGNGAELYIEPVLDLFAVIVSGGAVLLALTVAGLGPALQSTRADVRTALAIGGESSAPRWRGRQRLITLQVAVSVLLLAVAGLCVTQVVRESRHDTGLDLDRLALLDVDFVAQKYDEPRVRQIVDAVVSQVGHTPGVEAVAASSGLPLGISTPGGSIRSTDRDRGLPVELVAATSGIFQALGVRIVGGRAFDERDTRASVAAVVLSERAATVLFETTNVVGRQAVFRRAPWVGAANPKDEPVTIIGVAADTDVGVAGRRESGVVYLPLDQHYEGRLVFTARASGRPDALVGVLRRAIHSVDPDIAATQSGTATALVGGTTLFFQIMAVLASVLGSLALVLALAGLYGALSHVIACRTREIGVRLALGATAKQILRMVLLDGLRPVVTGLVLGSGIGFVLRLGMQPLFVRMLPKADVVILLVVPLSIVVCGLIACVVPAKRAASVEPNLALRNV